MADFSALNAAVQTLETDVTAQEQLQQAHDDAAAGLLDVTNQQNAAVQAAQQALAAATAALQAGAAKIAADQNGVTNAIAALVSGS